MTYSETRIRIACTSNISCTLNHLHSVFHCIEANSFVIDDDKKKSVHSTQSKICIQYLNDDLINLQAYTSSNHLFAAGEDVADMSMLLRFYLLPI